MNTNFKIVFYILTNKSPFTEFKASFLFFVFKTESLN